MVNRSADTSVKGNNFYKWQTISAPSRRVAQTLVAFELWPMLCEYKSRPSPRNFLHPIFPSSHISTVCRQQLRNPMDDIPNMHVPPNEGQVSQYSELSGATVPTTKPFYPLPEKTYYPEPYSAKTLPPSMHPTMNPVIFDNPIYGGLGVPVVHLSQNAFPPADMTDGSKIVFGSYPHINTIVLRFMVCS